MGLANVQGPGVAPAEHVGVAVAPVGVRVNVGRVPVGVTVGVLVGSPPPHVFSSTDTLLESKLQTTRSGLPSLLKSPVATEVGPVPIGRLVAAPKPPLPLPNITDMLLE